MRGSTAQERRERRGEIPTQESSAAGSSAPIQGGVAGSSAPMREEGLERPIAGSTAIQVQVKSR